MGEDDSGSVSPGEVQRVDSALERMIGWQGLRVRDALFLAILVTLDDLSHCCVANLLWHLELLERATKVLDS